MKLYILIALTAPFAAGMLLPDSHEQTSDHSCSSNAYPPTQNWTIPTKTVNLDLPPEQRWNDLGKEYGKLVRAVVAEFVSMIPWPLNKILLKLVNSEVPNILPALPQEYALEMQGIANATGATVGEIVFFNIVYEFSALCTSIVTRGPNGAIYHARNMDFGIFMGWDWQNRTWALTEKLRPLTVNLNFQKSGKTVFSTVHYIGFIGAVTGVRPGNYSISINERYQKKGGWYGIYKWVKGNHTGQWLSFASRAALQYNDDYESVKTALSNTPLIAPVYFIIASDSDGCVISRSQDSTINTRCISDDKNQWYVLETNYDWWEKPLFFDNRRGAAIKCMNTTGQNGIGEQGLFNVLNSKPVLNRLTVYTAYMEPSTGVLRSWLRFCPAPCPLF